MMEYAGKACAETVSPRSEGGQLAETAGGLAQAAKRISGVSELVGDFLTRCHGPTPQAVGNNGDSAPRPSGHLGAIQSNFSDVWSALERLERQASSLSEIG